MRYQPRLFPAIFKSAAVSGQLRKVDEDLLAELSNMNNDLKNIFDKGISFSENFDCVFVTYTSNATPNTEDTVAHTLGKLPTGYIPILKDKAGDFYNTSSPTKTDLLIKCSVASVTTTLLVF
jgi:hypothetical protein